MIEDIRSEIGCKCDGLSNVNDWYIWLSYIAVVVGNVTLNQRVVGSNPTAPTNKINDLAGFRTSFKEGTVERAGTMQEPR